MVIISHRLLCNDCGIDYQLYVCENDTVYCKDCLDNKNEYNENEVTND